MDTAMGKGRRSNIELLRIAAMTMIIMSHLITYGLLSGMDPYTRWKKGSFINRLWPIFFEGGGDTGVGIFFIITGFFLAHNKKIRNIVPLIFQMYFYGIVVSIMAVGMKIVLSVDVSLVKVLSQAILPVFGTNWWFMTAYVILVFSSPVINEAMDKIGMKGTLILMFAVMGWYSFGLILDSPYYPLLRAVWYYMAGAFIARKGKGYVKWKIIAVIVISWGAYFTLAFWSAAIKAGEGSAGLWGDAARFTQIVILSPVMAISIFLLFKEIEVGTKKRINRIASTTLAVYLFHEAPYNRILLWDKIFRIKEYYASPFFPLFTIVACVLVFAMGMGIELLRRKMIENLSGK